MKTHELNYQVKEIEIPIIFVTQTSLRYPNGHHISLFLIQKLITTI